MQPIQQVAILPRFPGEVISVNFNVGDTVEAGDILFTIDVGDIETNIAALEAQLAVQDAMVQSALTGMQLLDGSAMQSQILAAAGGVAQAKFNLEQAALGVEQAKMGYDLAEQGFADAKTLFEAGVMARSAFEQAEAGYLNAVSALERANIGHSMAEIALTQALESQRILLEEAPTENLRRAGDVLAQAQAARNAVMVNLKSARDRLEDASVTSPISGVVERRNVEPFSFAAPQSPAFLISAQDSMTVSFRVPRNSVAYLKISDTVSLHDGIMTMSGAITEIGTMVDAGGLITVSANIPNPPSTLLSGTSVRVFVDTQRVNDVPIIPLSAVYHERGVPHVFIAEDGVARSVVIETGLFDSDYVHVISGLEDSPLVINTWSARLSDGVEIEIGG
jgi:multidrug efflux pump subunit AcrA (membrane-fusion protein)